MSYVGVFVDTYNLSMESSGFTVTLSARMYLEDDIFGSPHIIDAQSTTPLPFDVSVQGLYDCVKSLVIAEAYSSHNVTVDSSNITIPALYR